MRSDSDDIRHCPGQACFDVHCFIVVHICSPHVTGNKCIQYAVGEYSLEPEARFDSPLAIDCGELCFHHFAHDVESQAIPHFETNLIRFPVLHRDQRRTIVALRPPVPALERNAVDVAETVGELVLVARLERAAAIEAVSQRFAVDVTQPPEHQWRQLELAQALCAADDFLQLLHLIGGNVVEHQRRCTFRNGVGDSTQHGRRNQGGGHQDGKRRPQGEQHDANRGAALVKVCHRELERKVTAEVGMIREAVCTGANDPYHALQ